MGVNLRDLFESETIEMKNLANKTLAVDSFNWIFQFLSTIRQREGQLLMDSEGRVTSHLSGLFYRCSALLKNQVKPIFVFDGVPPKFKEATREKRREVKEKAKIEYKKALEKGDTNRAYSLSMRTATVNKEVLGSAKELLKLMGIPYIDAPSEGEAQCSYLNQIGKVDYVATQDYDAILFGAKNIIRNLNTTGKRKIPYKNDYVMVLPELIEVQSNLKRLNLTRDQIILIAMLVGNDYTPGIKGIGPKKALKLVREKKQDEIIKEYSVNEKIISWFQKPNVKDFDFKFEKANIRELREFLLSHDFTENRINNTLSDLEDAQTKRQSSLDSFF